MCTAVQQNEEDRLTNGNPPTLNVPLDALCGCRSLCYNSQFYVNEDIWIMNFTAAKTIIRIKRNYFASDDLIGWTDSQ